MRVEAAVQELAAADEDRARVVEEVRLLAGIHLFQR
jgi:hypothetical protein